MNKLTDSIKEQIEAFQKGFYEIIPRDTISIFNEQACRMCSCIECCVLIKRLGA